MLVELYKSYQNAEDELQESTLQVEIYWQDLRQKLEYVDSIWTELDTRVQNLYERTLQVLYGKLQASITLINGLIKESEEQPSTSGIIRTGEPKKTKYAIRMKENLQSSIQDLKTWNELYKMLTLVMTRAPKKEPDCKLRADRSESAGDSALTVKTIREIVNSKTGPDAEKSSQSIFFSQSGISWRTIAIPHTKSEILKTVKGTDGTQMTLLIDETIKTKLELLSNVRDLARLLKLGDPFAYSILPCDRVYRSNVGDTIECRFAFAPPPNLSHPQSLREVLVTGEEYRDLNEKFSIAKQLSKAVLFVHSARFVHKNIRPETIIIMEEESSATKWPFLVGFERFRLEGGKTQREGDKVWEKNLYRHPYRQGEHPEVDYIMQHDIYSLGVCLLEIGLGISFIAYKTEKGHLVALPSLQELSEEVNSTAKQNQRTKAFRIKKCLVDLAEAKLPRRMGRKYTDIVITCLTCLDQTGNKFGTEADYYDKDGILVGVRYIEKVSFTSVYPTAKD